MIRDYEAGFFQRVKSLVFTKKFLIITVSILVAIGIVVGIVFALKPDNRETNNNEPSIRDFKDYKPVTGLSGEKFIKIGTRFLTRDIDNYLELAPLFNPSEQGWFLNETSEGIYTIKNLDNGLYVTGINEEFKYKVNKRSNPDRIPNVLVELMPFGSPSEFYQQWLIESKDNNTGFSIKSSSDSHIGVYGHQKKVMFGKEFFNWNFTTYDNYIPDHHNSTNDDPETDKKPSGYIVWYKNEIWKIQHKHLGRYLFGKSDNSVGLLEDFNVQEQIWNVTKGEWQPDFILSLYGEDLCLSESLDNEISLEPYKKYDTKQRWKLMNSSVKRIHGIKNVRSGRFLYIADPDGDILTTQEIHQGWNSWKFVETDPTNTNKVTNYS